MVNLINSEEVWLNELGFIVEPIRFESKENNFVFIFSPGLKNIVTHEIVIFALSITDLKIWKTLFLEWLILLVLMIYHDFIFF